MSKWCKFIAMPATELCEETYKAKHLDMHSRFRHGNYRVGSTRRLYERHYENSEIPHAAYTDDPFRRSTGCIQRVSFSRL